jgi:hypothetical protein
LPNKLESNHKGEKFAGIELVPEHHYSYRGIGRTSNG